MELNKEKIEALFRKNWRLIGIVYYGRSGSYFLQSILDGHPQILALPPYINNMYNVTFDHTRNIYREKFTISSVNKIFDPVIATCLWDNAYENPVSSGPSCYFGEERNIIFSYSYEKFIEIFNYVINVAAQGSLTISRKNIYLSIFFTYNLMIGKDVDTLLRAEYLMCQLHTPIADELIAVKKDFNDLRYLVSIREPVSAFISHIQAYNDMLKVNFLNEGAYNHCVPLALEEILNGAVMHNFFNEDHCRAIKNEYLHIYQDQYTKSLLDYLKLPWSDMCGKSTIDGEIFWWKYDTKYKTGYNKNYKWKICDKANVSCSDKRFFSALLKDRYEAWGYQSCPDSALDIGKKFKKGFEFIKQLNLSEYIQDAFLRIILHYYEHRQDQQKNYIPVLEFTPHEARQSLTCAIQQPREIFNKEEKRA